MMAAFAAFALTAPTAFLAGWLARGFRDRHKGMVMNTRNRDRMNRLLDWLSDPRKLVALVMVVGLAVLSSIVYTWATDRQSDRAAENRTDSAVAAVVKCIALYVRDTSESQAPRTAASVAANDARRDWDAGYSDDHPGLSKEQLKSRYLRLYAEYVAVRGDNPTLPAFSLDYCAGGRQ